MKVVKDTLSLVSVMFKILVHISVCVCMHVSRQKKSTNQNMTVKQTHRLYKMTSNFTKFKVIEMDSFEEKEIQTLSSSIFVLLNMCIYFFCKSIR